MSGTLFIVATPLGNLEDLSPRAIDTLTRVSCIACEDTRRTARLLGRNGIKTSTVSCHKFNESARLESILDRLRQGQDIALVSDGGTPGVSDPGSLLVRAAMSSGLTVCPIPGPSAVATLLSASGLPADRYVFEGFLPHRAGERRRRLRAIAEERRTVVFFETPHRIREALADIADIFGERPLVLGRELTKQHETILRGTAAELVEQLGDEIRGEITVAMAGASEQQAPRQESSAAILERWRTALDRHGGDRRAALRETSRELGLKRAELYRLLAEHGEDGS